MRPAADLAELGNWSGESKVDGCDASHFTPLCATGYRNCPTFFLLALYAVTIGKTFDFLKVTYHRDESYMYP